VIASRENSRQPNTYAHKSFSYSSFHIQTGFTINEYHVQIPLETWLSTD